MVKTNQNIFNLLGIDCRNLNEFSYGSVDVNSKTGIGQVTLEDENGKVIKDQLNQDVRRTKTFGASSPLSTNSQPFKITDNIVTPTSNLNTLELLQ